jgi:hypothetical protein
VDEYDGSKGATYRVDIVYTYRVGKQQYRSSRYDFMGGSSSGYGSKQAAVDRYPRGKRTVCYVNPANPADAVLDRDYPDDLRIVWFVAIFPLTGIGGLVGTWISSRRRGISPWSPPVLPASGVTISGVTVQREPGNIGIVSADPPGTKHHDTPVELQPSMTSGYKALVSALFLVLCGGGFAALIIHDLPEWRMHGAGASGLFVITIMLGAITLLVLASTVTAFMRLSDPRIQVRIAPGTVRLGRDFTLEWRAQGGRRRLSRLNIGIECREESDFQAGKSGGTAISACYRADLVDTQQPDELAAGTLTMRLPDGVMHSFNGGRNRIVWKMRVTGTVPRWVGVKDEYPLVILPEEWEGAT